MNRLFVKGMTLALSAIMLVAAGCSGGATTKSAPPAATGKQVEINMVAFQGVSTEAIIDINEAFNKANPNIKVRLKDAQGLQLLAAGQPNTKALEGIDVVLVPNNLLRALASNGIVKDLSAVKVPKLNDVAAKVFDDLAQVDGKRYGLTLNISPNMMLINEQAITKAGAKMPAADWTWQDLEQILLAVKNTGGTFQVNADNVLDPLVRSYGGVLYDADKKEWTFDSPEVRQALSVLGSMGTKGLINTQGGGRIEFGFGPGGGQGGDRMIVVQPGQGQTQQQLNPPAVVAFGGGGFQNMQGYTSQPYPRGPKGQFAPVSGTLAAVTATSANSEAALEYVKFLLSAEAQTFLAKGGTRPVTPDAKAMSAWQERVGDARAKAIDAALKGAYVSSTGYREVVNSLSNFITGKADLETAISTLKSTIK